MWRVNPPSIRILYPVMYPAALRHEKGDGGRDLLRGPVLRFSRRTGFLEDGIKRWRCSKLSRMGASNVLSLLSVLRSAPDRKSLMRRHPGRGGGAGPCARNGAACAA